MRRWLIILALSGCCLGQTWSGIVATSRAIRWDQNAGLPATFPDGETTTNPWTPPTRSTQCVTAACNTLSGGTVTAASINAALSSCPQGDYALVPSGTFTISSGAINLNTSNCTLRGNGPMSTILKLTGTSLNFGTTSSAATALFTNAAGNYTQGTTTIVVNTVSGTALAANQIAHVYECDTGISGASCGTGTNNTDNNSIWVCAELAICDIDGGAGFPRHQQQTVLITNVVNNGGGQFTLTISPGLYMPNWAFARTPQIETAVPPTGMGLENMTIWVPSSGSGTSGMDGCYACWVTGVRFVSSQNGQAAIEFNGNKSSLFANNYIFGTDPANMGLTGPNEDLVHIRDSDNLWLNNIITYGFFEADGFDSGNVVAYNFIGDSQNASTGFPENAYFEHMGSPDYELMEGNELGVLRQGDDTWGSSAFGTSYRNIAFCADPPASGIPAFSGIDVDSFSRFHNALANVIGATSGGCGVYQAVTDTGNPVFRVGDAANDTLTGTTLFRWANVSPITQASDTPTNSGIRCVSSEVPSSLGSPNAAFSNAVPSLPTPCGGSATLPASFFMSTTAHPSGGTGLSWYKVCKAWSSFPSTCTATTTPAFPAAGPDITGGQYLGGMAYDIPAAIAQNWLPVDTSFQNSYTITASSWSGGIETLTVTVAGGNHLQGGFTPPGGWAGACNPASGVSFTGRPDNEIRMTTQTGTTIGYALASNPGANNCTGTMKFPDVRKFDAPGVYLLDSSSSPATSFSPTSLAFGNQTVNTTSSGQATTLTNTGGATLNISSITLQTGTQFAISANTCGSTLAASASCNVTVTFTPLTTGAKSDNIQFTDDASGSPQSVPLSGTGTAAPTGSGCLLNGGIKITGGIVCR